ncbi:Uncharacterised protein [Vibrio cholerae]|nr:Uncharacterised protein [Vibrio cholerae]
MTNTNLKLKDKYFQAINLILIHIIELRMNYD